MYSPLLVTNEGYFVAQVVQEKKKGTILRKTAENHEKNKRRCRKKLTAEDLDPF